jgi:hypothetical protein
MTLPNQSMKSWRSVIHLALCILVISLLSVTIAEADQNFAGFRHIDEPDCLYSPNHRTERHREPTNPSTLDETATVEHASKCLMPRT